MFYDDLPIWGFIGKVEKIMSQSTKSWEKHELKYYLFTHIHFDILYNGDRVIEVNVSTDPSRTVEITEGENVIVDWTYSVKWRETSIPFEKRMEKYSRYSFLPQHLEVCSHHLLPHAARQNRPVALLGGARGFSRSCFFRCGFLAVLSESKSWRCMRAKA